MRPHPVAAPDTPVSVRPYLAGAIAGVVSHWLLAIGLWFAAHAVAFRQCLDDAFGLSVEGGGVTATGDGCVVDVPTTQGQLEVLLPTLHSGFAAAAAVLAALGAIWPVVLLVAFSRRAR